MKAILHIGTEKTGTTTLQSFLYLNRERLLKNGYLYTLSAGKQNNRRLCVCAYDQERRDEETARLSLNNPTALSDFRDSLVERLKDEIHAYSANVVIFSSEHFHSRLVKESEIRRLKSILSSLGLGEIQVVVYLRNPVELATSCYSSYVRNGGTRASPPSPDNPYFRNICDHQATLEKWSNIFGKESISPRVFEKRELIDGSIVADFIHHIHLPPLNYEIPKSTNRSTTPLGLEVLRRLNKEIDILRSPSSKKIRKQIIHHVENSFSNGKYVMPLSLQKEYSSFFDASNEWVRENYFPKRDRLFEEQLAKPEFCFDEYDIDLDEVCSFISKVLRMNMNSETH